MSERLYLADSTLIEAHATVIASTDEGIVLDRTPFYPRGGGQPGDSGTLTWQGGRATIIEARKGLDEGIVHVPAEGAARPLIGTAVLATIDARRRVLHMRMHTALHLLCALLPNVAVTGGQIGADRSRLDVDLATPPPNEVLESGLTELVAGSHPVTTEWVDRAILDLNPGLVRTLSVKPPQGSGQLRLVRIGTQTRPIDLQPCGGTHVGHTGLVGRVRVLKIENKGRQNRRIAIALED